MRSESNGGRWWTLVGRRRTHSSPAPQTESRALRLCRAVFATRVNGSWRPFAGARDRGLRVRTCDDDVSDHACTRGSQSSGLVLGGAFQRTAARLKTRMEMVVRAAAKTATTARLRVAIRVLLCMFQMLWSPVLSPSSP